MVKDKVLDKNNIQTSCVLITQKPEDICPKLIRIRKSLPWSAVGSEMSNPYLTG